MNYKSFLIVGISILLYAVLDMAWAGYLMKDHYINWLVHIIRPISQWNFSHGFAAAFKWVLIVVGVFIFVIPLVIGKSLGNSFLYGALFGAILYGLYETTNYAIIYAWQPGMVVVDTLWGACACGVITLVMKYLLQVWGKY